MYTLVLTQLECVMILVSEIAWKYPPFLESYSRQIKDIGLYFMRIHEPLKMVGPDYCGLLPGSLCNIWKLRFLWFLPTGLCTCSIYSVVVMAAMYNSWVYIYLCNQYLS